MPFSVGDVVRISEIDGLRGGDTATVKQILRPAWGTDSLREYLVEFENPPKTLRNAKDRFLHCIYREDSLKRHV